MNANDDIWHGEKAVDARPLIERLQSLVATQGESGPVVPAFYRRAFDELDRLVAVLSAWGLEGARLPKNVRVLRISVPGENEEAVEQLVFQQRGNPYGEGERWFTLNGVDGNELPPFEMAREFLEGLAEWLISVVDFIEKVELQGALAFEKADVALELFPRE